MDLRSFLGRNHISSQLGGRGNRGDHVRLIHRRDVLRRAAALMIAGPLASRSSLGQEGPTRRLAPGVLTVIPPEPLPEETFSETQPLVEITEGITDLEWTPNTFPAEETLLEMAKRTILRREVWCLEFAFKPMRMIEVDVPQPSGRLQRKVIWYLVYRIRYLGDDLKPVPQVVDQDGHVNFPTFDEVSYQTRRFLPRFILESAEYDKAYLEQILPAAKRPIELRERVGRPLNNSVEMMTVPIKLSTATTDNSVWGVVTWEDVDPRIDYFSVFIRGLTNGYRDRVEPGAFTAGDPPGTGRQLAFKTLRLNFWRPGDAIRQVEDEIRFGVPIDADAEEQARIVKLYGLEERLDYLWVYR